VIHLPSLEERRQDIPSLAQHFLTRCPADTGQPGPDRFAPEVISVLQMAEWPGNVRQLEMVIRDAYLRARNNPTVRVQDLSDLVSLSFCFQRRGDEAANAQAIQRALEATHGRVQDAAKLLRISRSALYAYIRSLDRLASTNDASFGQPAIS